MGRVPTTVQRKLLVAFGIVVVLLITVGVLCIGVLSQSNDRVEALGTLPQREAAYRQLAIDSDQLASLLSLRGSYVLCLVAPNPLACPTGEIPTYTASTSDIDGEIYLTLTQLSLLIDVANLGFSPPTNELRILTEVGSEYRQIAAAMATLIGGDQRGVFSKPQAEQDETDVLVSNADQLVGIVQSATANLIAQNQAAYLNAQHLVIGVAAGSVVLALVLGLALSRSLTGPIRTMDTRLAAIAAGDFSGHVDVPNRDELGTLAANLNRMNDHLGRLYRELETASRHKSEFLSNMSHELRTPLNAVIGFSEVLQDRLFGDLNEKQAEYVADIHTSGRHLLTLINDILDLSKVEAGRMELQVSTFALSDVLENAVALTRERATRQGISLCLTVDPSTGAVDADERKIKQVLFNLLTNALKFTARGGHVDITSGGDGEEAVVSVRDDGVGIAPADQVRIFEEFRQIGASQSQEGTGLGLALSRSFVELHGGRLWVESEPGRGSTFMFNLPRTQGASATAKNDRPRNPEAAGVVLPNAALLS
jgi:signal transduction histidine kinase